MTPGFHIRNRRTVRGRRWWVTLVASNGETLSHSEMLNSEAAAWGNVSAQSGLAPSAEVIVHG
jgi:uncharacterized protein YegP (UPF0339 family)